jgi:hypothetical protein
MARSALSVRRGVSTLLSALLVWATVAAPMLERGTLLGGGRAVESQHDLAECPDGHDHRICTQIGANRALTAQISIERLDHFSVRVAPPSAAQSSPSGSALRGPHSRAPPLV